MGEAEMIRKHSPPVMAIGLLLLAIVLGGNTLSRAESDSTRTNRLFMWASSGEVRFQDKVAPAKDSLAAMGEKAAKWLARRLDATDARERRTLADIFEKMGPAGAPPLIPYLDSSGIYMPQNAARCLGLAKDTSATLPLTRQLDHSYYAVRSEVATAIGKINDRRGVAPLLKRLGHEEDSDVRKSCVVALGLLADPQSAGALIEALSDPFFGVRQTAIISLGQTKPFPTEALIESTRTLTGIALHGALVALGGSPDSKAQKFLFSKLEDLSPITRAFAVEGLAAHPDKKTLKRVQKMRSKETDPFVLAQITRLEKRFKP
ncbi:MAG: HEAT repeat domain-containing protein [candidate division Zixibacteria bacterium]|nr:HEAT repeat domain-containing protein [candidate division Zixibacteria bacterium]